MAALADEYVAKLGRAQKSFQEYGTAGRSDLQAGAHTEAEKIRAQAKAAGVDLNSYGTKNAYGNDYTSAYTAPGPAGVYDPTKAGRVVRDAGVNPNTTDTTSPSTPDSTPVTVPSGPSSSDLINSIYNNNYESQAAKIRIAREQALAGLAGQDTKIKSEATANLNQNDVTSAQNANALREHMANLGILPSGDYISQQVGQNTATQQNANDIRQNASQRLEQLLAMENQIKNSANDQDLSLLKDIQSQIAKAQLDQSNTDRQFGLSEAGVTGIYKGNYTPTGQGQILSNQNQQFTNQISQLKLQNLPQELKLGLDKLEQDVKSGAINIQTAQYQLDELKDPNSVTNKSRALSLKAAELGNLELQKRIDEIGKKPALTPDEQRLKQIDLAKAEIELKNLESGGTGKAQTFDSLRTTFDSIAQRDKDTGKLTNPVDVEKSILASNISEYEKYRAYIAYGIHWDGAIPSPN